MTQKPRRDELILGSDLKKPNVEPCGWQKPAQIKADGGFVVAAAIRKVNPGIWVQNEFTSLIQTPSTNPLAWNPSEISRGSSKATESVNFQSICTTAYNPLELRCLGLNSWSVLSTSEDSTYWSLRSWRGWVTKIIEYYTCVHTERLGCAWESPWLVCLTRTTLSAVVQFHRGWNSLHVPPWFGHCLQSALPFPVKFFQRYTTNEPCIKQISWDWLLEWHEDGGEG